MNKVLTIYFAGTGSRAEEPNGLSGLLLSCGANSKNQKHIGVEGPMGIWGFVFGSGLDGYVKKQLDHVVKKINKNKYKVTLNVFGYSRGGLGALMLADKLSEVDPDLLSINLILLDPVPGNLTITSKIDPFNVALANIAQDLSKCKPLNNVLVLYSAELLKPTLAPVFPLYPSHANVIEDISPGDHFAFKRCQLVEDEVHFMPDGFIGFTRVLRFLQENGSEFNSFPSIQIQSLIDVPGAVIVPDQSLVKNIRIEREDEEFFEKKIDEALLAIYPEKNKVEYPRHGRHKHTKREVRIDVKKKSVPYFNRHHQQLMDVPEDSSQLRMCVKEKTGFFANLRRRVNQHPHLKRIVYWSLFCAGLIGLFFLTGAVTAIPFVSGLIAILGLSLGTVVLAAIVTLALAGIWYFTIKPASSWALHRFFYPDHDSNPLDLNHAQPTLFSELEMDSTHKIFSSLEANENEVSADIIEESNPLRRCHSDPNIISRDKLYPANCAIHPDRFFDYSNRSSHEDKHKSESRHSWLIV